MEGRNNDKNKLQAWLKLPFKRNWAKGSRLEHFQSYVSLYADALLDDTDDQPTQAVIDSAINTYFEKFSWRDPTSHEPPTTPPDRNEVLNEEDTNLKGLVIAKMRNSVTNWLHYRAIKAVPYHNLKKLDNDDPFAILLGNLTGLAKPGKRLAGWQEFLKFGFDPYRQVFETRVKEEDIPKKRQATERNQYAQKVFGQLEPAIQAQWNAKAKERHDIQVQEWAARKSTLTTLTPHQRQDLHAGRNRDAVPKTWGEADATKFDQVTANFLEFLETCYSRQDRLDASITTDPSNHSGGGRLMATSHTATSHTASRSTQATNALADNPNSALEGASSNHRGRPVDISSSDDSDDEYTSEASDVDSNDGSNTRRTPQHRGSRRKHHKQSRQHSPQNRKKPQRGRKRARYTSQSDDEAVVPSRKSQGKQRKKNRSVTPDATDHQSLPESSPPPPLEGLRIGPPSSRRVPVLPTQDERMVLFAYPTNPTEISPVHLVAPECDPFWPEWIRTFYAPLLNLDKMPAEWRTLLATYVRLEKQSGFENPLGSGTAHSLPSDHRPEEVRWWVKCGRNREVTITDINVFCSEWWAWWKGMQPVWRNVAESDEQVTATHRVHSKNVSEHPDAWTELDKPGQNGFLSIVASLGWWAVEVHSANRNRLCWTLVVPQGTEWTSAVYDVIWVMQRLHASRKNRLSADSA
ncbi:hypothetical protein ONZ45_g17656 [Pleurotus djamor]|nr:hypothetical protein ONZ45_g17656 [Pleurotus djamor]